jgi:hypothetical protein
VPLSTWRALSETTFLKLLTTQGCLAVPDSRRLRRWSARAALARRSGAGHQETRRVKCDSVAAERREQVGHIVELDIRRMPCLHMSASARTSGIRSCSRAAGPAASVVMITTVASASRRPRRARGFAPRRTRTSHHHRHDGETAPPRCCSACIHSYQPSAGIRTRPSERAASALHSLEVRTLSERA